MGFWEVQEVRNVQKFERFKKLEKFKKLKQFKELMFLPTGLMAFGKFGSHILDAEPFTCKQDDEMI